MSKPSKRQFFEIIIVILYVLTSTYLTTIFTNKAANNFRYQGVYILNIILGFILGMIINAINKKISFSSIKFNTTYLVIFVINILLVCLPWVFSSILPTSLTLTLIQSNKLIAMFAGAYFVSALFGGNNDNNLAL